MSIREILLMAVLLTVPSRPVLSAAIEPHGRTHAGSVTSLANPQTLIIRVAVVDGETWKPVEGARLALCLRPLEETGDCSAIERARLDAAQTQAAQTATTDAEGVALFVFHGLRNDRYKGFSPSAHLMSKAAFRLCPLDVAECVESICVNHPDYHSREIPIDCTRMSRWQSERSDHSFTSSPVQRNDPEQTTVIVEQSALVDSGLNFWEFCLEPLKQIEFLDRVRRLRDRVLLEGSSPEQRHTFGPALVLSGAWRVYLCDDVAIERIRKLPNTRSIPGDTLILSASFSPDTRRALRQ